MSGPNLFGNDLFGNPLHGQASGVLFERFMVPPFSVLDAKQGYWQERKSAWIAMGLKSEEGRTAKVYNLGLDANKENGWAIEDTKGSGTSVFDPLLCELVYRWFCPEGGQIVDPFAGGSVRGLVASMLGRDYWGSDLSGVQLEANRGQAEEVLYDGCPTPVWVHGDSEEAVKHSPQADLIFSCPPYGDLEVYSDDKADLSNMRWSDFLLKYATIINNSVSRLKDDGFACFVVGDFRDSKTGMYRNFVSETIAAFHDAGAYLYNEAILLTSIGTAMMRAGKQFSASRKFVKVHQNVLVFCKGSPKGACASLGDVDV